MLMPQNAAYVQAAYLPVQDEVCDRAGFVASAKYGFTPHDFHEFARCPAHYSLHRLEYG